MITSRSLPGVRLASLAGHLCRSAGHALYFALSCVNLDHLTWNKHATPSSN
ncbi:MAG: hypothetical protein IH602_09335 [Bryobacteraceae bacterium]|nr:hypothetical protein [Bryobacteraceae bacterium]